MASMYDMVCVFFDRLYNALPNLHAIKRVLL